jgi:hypothetical protein
MGAGAVYGSPLGEAPVRPVVLCAVLALTTPLLAQTSRRSAEQIETAFNAHKGEFDFLLGDWEFAAVSKERGKMRGYWSAVKLNEGQILDEYRVVSASGETSYVTTTLRNYNGAAERWELVGADAGRGLLDIGTGRKAGSEMLIAQTVGVAGGEPSLWRIRYHNIRLDGFSSTADRSTDGGKTWIKNFQTIEARRIGPVRTIGALAPARSKKP